MSAELIVALPVAVLCIWAWVRVHDALSRWLISLARKQERSDPARRGREGA